MVDVTGDPEIDFADIESDQAEQSEEELPQAPTTIVKLSEIPSLTADENGQLIVKGITSSVDDSEKSKDGTKKSFSTCKSLYKEHDFTQDEIDCVTAYFNHEITGGEGAELLGLASANKFYNLVARVKRAKNLTANSKNPQGTVKPETAKKKYGQKLTEDDLDYIYRQVKRGDTMSALAKDYKVASSTLTIRMHAFIKKNNLEPLFINGRRREEVKKPVINKAEPKISPKTKLVAKVPAGTPDGWRLASDEKFHLIENGVIVE